MNPIRTRNLENVKYGAKFYSINPKGDFGIIVVKDSAYSDVAFAKYTYHVGENTSFGFYSGLSKIDYNIISVDFAHYIPKLSTSLSGQVCRWLNTGSDLKFFEISRSVQLGLSGYIDYMEVGKDFLSDFNDGSLYFDNYRGVYGTLSYRMPLKFVGREGTVKIWLYGEDARSKDGNSLISREMSAGANVNFIPLVLEISTEKSRLNYLNLPDNTYLIFSPSLGYYRSSWNKAFLVFSLGKYLGGNFFQPEIIVNVSPFGMNTGVDAFFVRSIMDSMLAVNFYGEYKTPIPRLLIRPSVIYQKDYRQNVRDLDFNLVFVYEPGYLKGIYLAYQRSLEKSATGERTVSGKVVFKVNWGFKKRPEIE